MKILTPVKTVQINDSVFIVESDGAAICDAVTTELCDEIAKRINMHDDLVEALKHIQCLVLLPKDIADNVNKLLEKCNG